MNDQLAIYFDRELSVSYKSGPVNLEGLKNNVIFVNICFYWEVGGSLDFSYVLSRGVLYKYLK